MSPMQLFDGSITRDGRLERESALANRRLIDLAAAIREHEQSLRREGAMRFRAQDDHLYRRLRQICGD
jgi:hypothetical protein